MFSANDQSLFHLKIFQSNVMPSNVVGEVVPFDEGAAVHVDGHNATGEASESGQGGAFAGDADRTIRVLALEELDLFKACGHLGRSQQNRQGKQHERVQRLALRVSG